MRARNLKPGFFKNEELADLPPLTRLLFAGLWCMADREGRLEDRPKRIKAEVMPYDNCDVEKALQSLHDHTFITRYSAENQRLIQITNFAKHQNPHVREPKSALPPPGQVQQEHGTSTVLAPYKHSADTEVAPVEHSESTEPARLIPHSLIPHSLIPHSLIQDINVSSTHCRAEPDAVPLTTSMPTGKEVEVVKPQNGHLPYSEIVSHLNRCSGSSFRANSEATKALIKARFNQGFTLDDFLSVISYKCEQWKIDPAMSSFMRPQTLFGPKFEAYLNEATRKKPDGRKYSTVTARSIANTRDWRPPQ